MVVNGQNITTITIYVDLASLNISTLCGFDYDTNSACPNISAAINSYRSLPNQPLTNTILNIALAGGQYCGLDGNSGLNVNYLNVTIGPSPYNTQGEVIIDLYHPPTNKYSDGFFIYMVSASVCTPQTNITLNNLTLTNGTKGINSMNNNVNIILNNVTITNMVTSSQFNYVIYLAPPYKPCYLGQPLPTLTIQGGGIFNSGLPNSDVDLINVESSSLTISNYGFYNNTANTLISTFSGHVSIEGSTFQNNSITRQLLWICALNGTSLIAVDNSTFIDNHGVWTFGNEYLSLVYIMSGNFTINNSMFINNNNYSFLISVDSRNLSITGSTFANNSLINDPYETVLISIDATFVIDNTTFKDNTASTELVLIWSHGTLSNVVFGNVDGLEGSAIECQGGYALTVNDIDNHLGRNLFGCHQSMFEKCNIQGNFHLSCPMKEGELIGIVVGSVCGLLAIIIITILLVKKYKKRNQYKAIQ
ncbi:hypothetical protein SAMD00019534_113620 [Acytostelium subglobosum LB1]|uniref:hypothetical protein n=1 Tax=Acytostelium subglobosum LB1 TaxID=1410327 RepID=UPI000644C403|nr:hypothetical protein SAMD00019534_113620 [Acytostelium subglobosum LB1]GAM28186.1 hypothetical protein SAMD00019534_113620 [Acytostelium subglobosum LB1]|eukprot:XP_012748820.1 hypothetical protein SAMD00019534_113620 [Acytostelium subglobosum LB1]